MKATFTEKAWVKLPLKQNDLLDCYGSIICYG